MSKGILHRLCASQAHRSQDPEELIDSLIETPVTYKRLVLKKKNQQNTPQKNPAKQKTTDQTTSSPHTSLLMNYFSHLSKLCTLVLVNVFSLNSQVLA